MANPNRGEVDFIFSYRDPDSGDDKREVYKFKFSNAGKRAVETESGMTRGQIMQTVERSMGQMDTIVTALFWGATRKFHARDFPTLGHVDQFMDRFEDIQAEQDDDGMWLQFELLASLLAAYLRRDKEQFKKQLLGEDNLEDELPKGTQEEPAATTTSTKTPKAKDSSKTGTDS